MKKILLLAFAIFLTPSITLAHTGVGSTSGFLHGLLHTVSGLDHMLAMIAVGIWATQLGKKATWRVPLAFVSIMILGGIVGIAGISIPFIEEGIVMSVLILGILIAAAKQLPLSWSVAIVGLFAIFHGYAHGAEMPALTSGVSYALGFVLSTIALHLSGIGLGMLLSKRMGKVLRYAGAGMSISALILFLA